MVGAHGTTAQTEIDLSRVRACNPNEAPSNTTGTASTKKRRRTSSRRNDHVATTTPENKVLPPCRRARVNSPRLSIVSPKPSALMTSPTVVAASEAALAEMERAEVALGQLEQRAKERTKMIDSVKIKQKEAEHDVEAIEVAEAKIEKTMKIEFDEVPQEKDEPKDDEAEFLGKFKTVVINMDRRPDRLEGCASRLATFCRGLQWERMGAIDGRKTVISPNFVTSSWDTRPNVVYQKIRSIRKGWDDLHTYHERVLELSPGERGCAASHIKAWRHCLANGSDEPLIVLEDDAAPMPDFASILKRTLAALPNDAHILYLGYSQAAHWRREISTELVEAEYVWTTVGYIVWPAAARLMLSMLPINQPVDNWMAQLCASGKMRSYCVCPKLIRQSDAWNCGSDIRHSDESYWGPDSDIIHSETAPVPPANPFARSIPGAILDDGSYFWDLSCAQKEQMN